MAIILNGKNVADKINEYIKKEIERLGKKPGLAVVIVGDNPASKVYVNNKKKKALELGMESYVIELPEYIKMEDLEDKIEQLNKNPNITGILVQLPLPKHLDTERIIEKISPEKDVDGFHPLNIGKLFAGVSGGVIPCTPMGIIRLLDAYGIEVEGKNVVIIGRSNIVGKPLSLLMLKRNATVTVCHSKTKDLEKIAQTADILVSAVGKPKMVKKSWVKKDAVVIDVGINRDENGILCGDVDFEEVAKEAGFITPVPKGVGPMTISMLLLNTLSIFKQNLENN